MRLPWGQDFADSLVLAVALAEEAQPEGVRGRGQLVQHNEVGAQQG